MGWFGSSSESSTLEQPKASGDGGFIAPDRTARARCWEGRDSFFACLDRNKIIDSVKYSEKASTVCGKELEQFEKACASSWVGFKAE